MYSTMRNMDCGIPQGSVLGPLLFLIYVNDFPNSLKTLISIMFADDASTYSSHVNLHKAVEDINKDCSKPTNSLLTFQKQTSCYLPKLRILELNCILVI